MLLVEGADDAKLCVELMDFLGIKSLYIRGAGGKTKLRSEILALQAYSGLHRLRRIGVMRDADSNFEDAFRSVGGSIADAGFPVPEVAGQFTDNEPSSYSPRFGVFICPDNSSPGVIEDLCIESVMDSDEFSCVEPFSQCVSGLSNPPKSLSKSKALAFMAAQKEVCDDIGLAAKMKYWNFNAPCFEPLKSFLLNFK